MSVKTATLIALIGCITNILLGLFTFYSAYHGFHFGFIIRDLNSLLFFLLNNIALITLAVFLITLYRKQ
ncbi:hypothetical protein JW835_15710 [bacterium]|nr:hypothetical protein [bacterium]